MLAKPEGAAETRGIGGLPPPPSGRPDISMKFRNRDKIVSFNSLDGDTVYNILGKKKRSCTRRIKFVSVRVRMESWNGWLRMGPRWLRMGPMVENGTTMVENGPIVENGTTMVENGTDG